MELEDLKNSWDIANHQTKQQLTADSIDQMTQKKYNLKIRKIAFPELVGIAVCLLAALFIAANFYKLNTAFLQGTGVVSILLLLILSTISIVSLRQLTFKGDVNKPYAETLKLFANQKLHFFKLQKMNVTLSYLLLVTVIILTVKFFKGIDLTDSKIFWTFSFSFGYLFLLFYSKWVLKYYKKTLQQTEELLRETEA